MRTSKKVVGTLLAFGMAFFLAMNVGFAQEKTAKTADATETVSTNKDVKSTIVIPAKLVEAMVLAKAGKAISNAEKTANVQTYERWYGVIVTGSGDSPADLTVTGDPIPEPADIGACAKLNTGHPCAVKLTVNNPNYSFGSSSYTLNALPTGATLPSSPEYAKSIPEEN